MFAYTLPRLLHDVQGLDTRVARVAEAACASVQEGLCALTGHDYLRHTSRNRIYLRCADCGHETPGWPIEPVTRAHRSGPVDNE